MRFWAFVQLDQRVHADRGLTLAGLGRHEEALREARWLKDSEIYCVDFFQGIEGLLRKRLRAHRPVLLESMILLNDGIQSILPSISRSKVVSLMKFGSPLRAEPPERSGGSVFFPSLPAVRVPSSIDIPEAAGHQLCRKSDWNSRSLRYESFLVPVTFPRQLFLHQSAEAISGGLPAWDGN